MSLDLNLLKAFLAVAESHNFRVAAERLDVTRSSISQSIRRLEDGLGVLLVQRSTRSVRLTEAGERLYDQIKKPMAAMSGALDGIGATDEPKGLLRVAVTSIAEQFLNGPLIASFIQEYPGITLDVTVSDEEFDIIARGYDAGVRLGQVIEQDMIAVPVTGMQREVAVATAAYFAEHGRPSHPRDLSHHRCIGWRRALDTAPYRWEFAEAGRAFDVAVAPRLTTNDMLLMVRTALAGGGITFGMEDTFRPYLQRGELETVLDEYLPDFAGFYLYYPNRHNLTPSLRALLDHVRRYREQRASLREP